MKDNSISRIHFMIEVNPPQCRLTDMESTNGTRVNGRKVTTADLKDGDLITAGKTKLLVSMIGVNETQVTRTETMLTKATGQFHASLQCDPDAVPRFDFFEHVISSTDYSLQQQPPEKAPRSCRLCGNKLGDDEPAADGSMRQPPNLAAIWLCPECRGRIGNESQPIPGYQVVRELGQGGMGVVYQAIRTANGELVVLKTIKPAVDPTRSDLDRFLREARILSELDHPNIVSFHELGESNGVLFSRWTMSRARRRAVAEPLRWPPANRPRGRSYLPGALGLDYAHAKGFVHLDVKPSNMMVTQEGGKDVVRLSDFGLARIYLTSRMSGLSTDGEFGGTAPFMAPEQINDLHATKPSADQYGAAATLYNLLTDCFIYDFPKKLHAKIMKILLEDPVPILDRRTDIPKELATIIHRALARDPLARYANVREMRRALLPFAR